MRALVVGDTKLRANLWRSMSQIQEIARVLITAGGAFHPEGNDLHLLYTDDSTLTLKHWTGDTHHP